MPRNSSDPTLSEHHKQMLHDIDSSGWHVVKVCGEAPEWAYSVGLFQNFDHPEIVMFGLPPDLMHGIINDIAEDIQKRGPISADTRCSDYLNNLDVEFKKVHPRWLPPIMGQALWYYGNDTFPAIQCCWPDRENKLPTDSGYDESFNVRQPQLYYSTPDAAHLQTILADMNYTDQDA